jgi:cardiolipin synthase A/B
MLPIVDEWHEFIRWALATHAGLWLGAFIVLVLLSGMLRERRNPSASAAWLVFMLAVPYVAVPLYLALGTRKLKALERQKQNLFAGLTSLAPPDSPLQNLFAQLGVPDPATVTGLDLHADGQAAHSRLLALIDGAEQSIDIEIFILSSDATGRGLIDHLVRCAQRGVRVRLLLDGVGSFPLSRKHLKQLIQAGGEMAWFIPVLHVPLRGRTNLRNHRKLVIVDRKKVWSGGRNLANEYLQDEKLTRWYDLSFDLEGPAVYDFQTIFEADWAFARRRPPEIEERAAPPLVTSSQPREVQILPGGPDMEEDVLEQTLLALIREARHRILIVTPYFIPTETLQTLLCLSGRSGIQVELLLPEKSNHRIADFVRNRFLRELHKAEVNIHVLPDDMLHAKAWVIDDRFAVIGSANTDLRSLQLNFELMTLLYAQADVVAVRNWVDTHLARAQPWQRLPRSRLRETFEGLLMLLSFQL